MWLTDIFCSKVYRKDEEGNFEVSNRKFQISIEYSKNAWARLLFKSEIELENGENHIKLSQPAHIEAHVEHWIVMRSISLEALYTHKINFPMNATPHEAIPLKPKAKIYFPKPKVIGKRTVISKLNFKCLNF